MTRAIAAAWLALFAVAAAGAERIVSFQSDIQVLSDGSMEVMETISVIAEGRSIRRGIYRDFPTRYRTASGHRVDVGFDVVTVRRDGAPESWFTEALGNGVRVYAGRRDVRLTPGEHRYEIVYRTNRQLGFFSGHDELYWNVTGNGWAFPIEQALAYVYLPKTVPDSAIEVEAYTGPQGARGRDYEAGVDDDGVAWFMTRRALGAGEGLTIVTSWPKGHVREPTSGERARWFLEDNGHLLAGVLGVALLLAYYVAVWSKVGRDPMPGVLFPRYEPPQGYSPAAMRYIRRMGYDNKTFTAALVNLAVNGHVDIEESDGEFHIERRAGEGPLAPGEKALLDRLLARGQSLRLHRGNRERIRKAIDAHKLRLAADYERIYFNSNLAYTVAGVVVSLALLAASLLVPPGPDDLIGTLFMLVWLSGWTFGVVVLLASVVQAWRGSRSVSSTAGALVLTAMTAGFLVAWGAGAFMLGAAAGAGVVVLCVVLLGLNGLFYHLMKAPTLLGRELLDKVDGFLDYLGVAEKDELALRNPPEKTPELFERLLPYAIALDVEGVWGERFRRTLEAARARRGYQGPAWYRSPDAFSPSALSGALGAGLAAAVSASSSAPGSASGGGGSGSSGGGGGGGGGGGW